MDTWIESRYYYRMRILGIDPGIGRMGWGVIEFIGNKATPIAYDCFETSSKVPIPDRLIAIYQEMERLFDTYEPQEIGIEELFFGTNTTTAFSVGQARGVVLFAGASRRLPIGIYTPLAVKMAVTGFGRADKKQVGQMVKVLLNLPKIPTPDDTADALAIALTHAFSRKMRSAS